MPTPMSIGTRIGANSAHFAEAEGTTTSRLKVSRITPTMVNAAGRPERAQARRRPSRRSAAPMLESANAFVNSAREEHHHQVIAHRRHRRGHAVDRRRDGCAACRPCARRRVTAAAPSAAATASCLAWSGDPAPVREPSEALNGESAGHEAHASRRCDEHRHGGSRPEPSTLAGRSRTGAEGIRVGSPSTARPATRGSTTRSTIHHVAAVNDGRREREPEC